MLEEQLIQQERLQSQNEWLAQQVSSASLDQESRAASHDSSSHTAKNSLAEDERAAHIREVGWIEQMLLEKFEHSFNNAGRFCQ